VGGKLEKGAWLVKLRRFFRDGLGPLIRCDGIRILRAEMR
jgi:hypothetical protein